MSEKCLMEGWATLEDGSHISLSQAECEELIASVNENEARKAEAMPTTKEAIAAMFDARDRLGTLGWIEGKYCPKDGSPFAAIQHSSTGIFTGNFDGKWPYDFAHIEDEGMHPYGFMWKPLDQLTEWEEEMRQKSAISTSSHIERLGRS